MGWPWDWEGGGRPRVYKERGKGKRNKKTAISEMRGGCL